YAWYICVLEVGFGWLIRQQRMYLSGAVHIVIFSTFLPILVGIYIYLCSGRTTHSVPNYSEPSIDDIDVPHECLSDGSLIYCSKQACHGRWKPPGTHHCSTCDVCREGFDHHCPWLGNCVSAPRIKAFLLLLSLTVIAVPLGIIPIRRPLVHHISAALVASHADPWIAENWWNKWYSWIFFGGPPGRWILGILLGFRVLKATTPDHGGPKEWFDGSFIEEPHARLVAITIAASVFGVFAVAMAFFTLRDVLFGQTTLDAMWFRALRKPDRPRALGRFVSLPSRADFASASSSGVDHSDSQSGQRGTSSTRDVYPIMSDERLYDLGWRENWARLMRRPAFPRTRSTSRAW
ncbi:DHHC palmitoyltransferase-domain-containing protein, partial [Amylostereum chailletii]